VPFDADDADGVNSGSTRGVGYAAGTAGRRESGWGRGESRSWCEVAAVPDMEPVGGEGSGERLGRCCAAATDADADASERAGRCTERGSEGTTLARGD
jgi:hypothetical protein